MTSQTFEAFGFAAPLNRALSQCGYETPTPIQVQALPPQLEGRDLIGLAQTGSGKTATFVLPLLQEIAANPVEVGYKQVLTLVLAPTRELALQIDQEVASLSRNMNIRRAVVLGGVSKGPQINALKRGVHVLVATPGRLLDHVNMRSCDISGVRALVLDEADRMFDMGFIRDIRKIVSLIPLKRRTALFSATMPPEIKRLADEVLQDPARVNVSPKEVVVNRIDQKVMLVRAQEKQGRLHRLLNDTAMERVIVFARTKRGADRVAGRLGMAGINAVAFHGNKAQNARQRALSDFSAGHVRVLVATDIAARGIDVSNVTHVVNFDMPNDAETYVHRVGRTARKGQSGVAISLCDPSEKGAIYAIEKLTKQKLGEMDDIGGDPVAQAEPRARAEHGRRNDGERRDNRASGRPQKPRRDDGAPREARSESAPKGERGGERSGFGGKAKHRRGERGGVDRFNARGDRNGHSDRNEPSERGEHFGRKEHFERNERSERSERPARHERAERNGSSAHHEARPERHGRPDRERRDERRDRPERTERTAHSEPRHAERPRSEKRSFEGRSFEGRSEKQRFDGPRSDRPRSDRPRSERPHSEKRSFDKKPFERHAERDGNDTRKASRHDAAHGDRKHRHDDKRGAAPAGDDGRARNQHGKPHKHGSSWGKPRHGRNGAQGGNGGGFEPPKFMRQRAAQRAT